MKKLISLMFVLVIMISSVTVAFATNRATGDVDNSGDITISDVTVLQRHIAQLIVLDDEIFVYCDVDGDDKLTIMDCTAIQRFIAQIIEKFPVDEMEKPTVQPTEKETNAPIDGVTATEFELEVLRLVNIERAKVGAEPLEFAYFIYDCAKLRAEECDTYFSHTRPDGSLCVTVLEELGVEEKYSAYGENIAWGYTSAEAVVKAWMNSEGHRNNILSEDYDHLAVGTYECTEYPGAYSVVQIFWGSY